MQEMPWGRRRQRGRGRHERRRGGIPDGEPGGTGGSLAAHGGGGGSTTAMRGSAGGAGAQNGGPGRSPARRLAGGHCQQEEGHADDLKRPILAVTGAAGLLCAEGL